MDATDVEQTEDSNTDRLADELLAAHIFEPHWYAAQVDGYFRTHRAAALHFVTAGMQAMRSPHPLISPATWPDHLQQAWRSGNLSSVLRYLQRDPKTQAALGPLFDPRHLPLDPGTVATHPGGCLGAFLDSAGANTMIPTALTQIPFGEVQASWRTLYDLLKRHNKLTARRAAPTWQADQEISWRTGLGSELPSSSAAGEPLISIVMPAWNRAQLISRAIRTVQAQTLEDWELIVVDDGSTDTTAEVAEALASRDNRITVIRADHAGVSAARNVALDASRGKFVAFLDTDNAWEPEYLELMIRGMHTTGAKAAYAGVELHREGGVQYRAFAGGLDHLLVMNHIDLNVMMVERLSAVTVRFDTSLRRWVDHDFAIRVARRHTFELMPFVGCIYDDNESDSHRITTDESDSWQWVALGKNFVDWEQVSRSDRTKGKVSVVMPVYQDWKLTQRAVAAVLESSAGHDIEVIMVDNGSHAEVSATLFQLYASEPRVTYQRLPRNMNFAIGSNFGASLGTGEYICFLNNDTEVRDGWLETLLPHLEKPDIRGVQPLLVYPDESIQTAGTVFVADGSIPCHFLPGFPPEDAAPAGRLQFSAVTAACFVVRATEFISLNGFDPSFVNGMEDVDYCLRAVESAGGAFAVDPTARVTHHESRTPGRGRHNGENRAAFLDRWRSRLPKLDLDKFAAAGLRVAAVGGDQEWVPAPRLTLVRERPQAPQRWGIRYAANGGPRGNLWGDTFYVESLSTALRAQGQEVVSYRHGANTRSSFCLDDVNLVIRGLDEVPPIPGKVNILWIISHPTAVTTAELRAFDIVYAASHSWAKSMTNVAGRPVHALLQATDTRIFHPPAETDHIPARPPTFVGSNFKNRSRKVVHDALISGMDFRVIGAGWDTLPSEVLERDRIPNSELGAVYRDSQVVLADHWPDMAQLGFLQNRIFDAVACGTPVVVDAAQGLSETFGTLVQTYDTPDELRFLCSTRAAAVFGEPSERRAQANSTQSMHSFDARSKELVEAVKQFNRN